MASAPPVTLLTLEHAGRVWRYSSRPLSVANGSESYLYRGGIAPMDVHREAPVTGVAEPQSMAVELLVDDDLSAIASQQHLPSEIRAEIATIIPGQEWGQRDRYLQGMVDVQRAGARGQPLRLQVLGADPGLLPYIHPGPTHAISDDTWGTLPWGYDSAHEGKSYPQVFGEAGYIWAGASRANIPAVPVYSVALSTVAPFIRYTPWGDITSWAGYAAWPPATGDYGLVAGGYMFPGVTGNPGIVRAWHNDGATPPDNINAKIWYVKDQLGQVCTVLRPVGAFAAGGGFSPGREYYATIQAPCCGGVRYDYRDGLRGAGSIIRSALEQTARRVDWRRTSPALPLLDTYELGGLWDAPQDPWEWLCSEVFPLLPCAWIPGPNGLYPVIWRLDAHQGNCDIRLTDGLNCSSEGSPTYDDEPGQILHSLDYARSIYNGTWKRRATWHGRATREPAHESMSLHLRRAQLRFGGQLGHRHDGDQVVKTASMVYLDRTADKILGWQARLRSQPPMRLRVTGDGLFHRGALSRARPGMATLFNSSRHSMANRVAHVRRAGLLGGVRYADLIFLPSL